MKDLSSGKMHISNIVVIAIAILLTVGVLSFATKGRSKKHVYKAKRPLTQNEQAMYWRLVKALPNHAVLAQVNMSSCVSTSNQAARGTISQKSVDFVVCDKGFNVVAAIEIDDKSHDRPERVKADRTKNEAFVAAGIRLIRWRASQLPDAEEIVRTVIGAADEKREIPGRTGAATQPQERQPNSDVYGVAKRNSNELPQGTARDGQRGVSSSST